ncbi:MAG: hypothetical protein ABIH46_14380, partial [Chloroflexota bacterium]
MNRAIVIVVALVMLAGAVVTVLVASGVSTPQALPYGLFETELQRAADATGVYQAASILASVVVGLGMVVLLLFELMPSRKPMLLLVSSTEAGSTTIDRGSVRVLAETNAAAARNVRDVRCDVAEKASGLVISCRASIALGGNVTEVSAEL